MDSYLDIAAAVLRRARRPLGPRAILSLAYQNGLVPQHLHGKTQHKTLQARISEDIIARREQSQFFRSGPGLFFLRDFLADRTVPENYRVPMATRRRVRDLIRGPALAVSREDLGRIESYKGRIESGAVLSLLRNGHVHYGDPKKHSADLAYVWSFVSVTKANLILSYRQGRYRESRDAFTSRRTIGFSTLVHEDQSTLFNIPDFGIIDSGVHATMLDLDIPEVPPTHVAQQFRAHLNYFLWVVGDDSSSDLVAVIDFECPDWFEPMTRRLAINDLGWLDIGTVNDLDDFDPWSRSVMIERLRLREGLHAQSA